MTWNMRKAGNKITLERELKILMITKQFVIYDSFQLTAGNNFECKGGEN